MSDVQPTQSVVFEELKSSKALSIPSGPTGTKDMNAIVVLQNFNGSWDLNGSLASIFGVSLEKLKQAMTQVKLPSSNQEKIWATALALSFLNISFKHLKEDWEILAEKSHEYLISVAGSDVKSILDSAKVILSQLAIV